VDIIWQAALKGTTSDIEYRVIVGDQLKWVRAKVEVEFDRMGQPLLAKGFLQEISEGMGLGLSISRSIVETHVGTIRASANKDRGASFLVSLPIVPPECSDRI
jgi:nitrogen-specific signal transduction histidine kinase